VKLLDFNVSKIVEKDSEFVKDNENNKYKYLMFTKTGTPLYSAPEILTHFKYRYS
jgi:serine/threonine protein kinase